MNLRRASSADLPAFARLHAASFAAPWSDSALAATLDGAGVLALVAEGEAGPEGFVAMRVAGGEAEVLTLAVSPACRRAGLGLALMQAGLMAAREAGAETAFLEAAVDNAAAIGLYRKLGFVEVGRRPRYYARPDGARVDALLLSCDLTP